MELTLPAETAEWLGRFRDRVRRERQILGTLIAWGFAGAAFDIHRDIEARLKRVREMQGPTWGSRAVGVADLLGGEIRRILRSHYLEGLGVPRTLQNRRLLQGAYLNGFEKTAARLAQLYGQDDGEGLVVSKDVEAA